MVLEAVVRKSFLDSYRRNKQHLYFHNVVGSDAVLSYLFLMKAEDTQKLGSTEE